MASISSCPHCGKKVGANLDSCPYCGGFLRKSAPARSARAASKGGPQKCPSCNAVVQAGDIICVACGTSLLTGQKIVQDSGSRTGRGRIAIDWRMVMIAATVVVVVAGVAALSVWWLRDPVKRAVQLAANGRESEAAQILDKYVMGHPDDPRGHYELGKLHWKSQRFEQAADAFDKASEIDPRWREAALLAYLARTALPNPSARGAAIRTLERYSGSHPEDDAMLYLLGLTYGAAGDPAGQVEVLDRLLARAPDNAQAHVALGSGLALRGEYGEAEKHLTLATSAEPNDANIQATAGLVYALSGNHEASAARLEQAIAMNPEMRAEVRVQAALQFIETGRYEEADRHLTEVLRTQPESQPARFFHAVCLEAGGLAADALSDFERLSGETGPFGGAAALQAARLYLDRDETDRAGQMLDRAERAGASGASFYTLRGRVAARLNQDSDAQNMFRRAIQTNPSYAPAYLENGLVFVRRQVFSEGIESLQRYLELIDPSVAGARIEPVQTLIEQLEQTSRPAPAAPIASAANVEGARQ